MTRTRLKELRVQFLNKNPEMAFTNQLCVSLVESGVRGDQLGPKAFSPEHFHTWTFIAALLTYLARGRLPFYSDATTRTLGSGGFCRTAAERTHTRVPPYKESTV
jgi:hypothetical protein